jgi:hypothetical protein
MRILLARWNEIQGASVSTVGTLESASDDEILDFLDRKFGDPSTL